jgi:multiple sugar transport system permease protein
MFGLRKVRITQQKHESIAGYLFASPWIIGFIFFMVIPMGMSLYASFTHWIIVKPPPRWIGLDNFIHMFTEDPLFWHSLGVTIRYMIIVLPLKLVLGLVLSLLLNQKLPGMHLARTIFYIPAVVSGVAVSILWLSLLDPELGALNVVLRSFGIQDPPNWLNSSTWAVPAVALMSLWSVGRDAIIFLAGLQNIPQHLYESAMIDGANRWKMFWKITLPLISPTLFFMLIVGLIDGFQVFTPAYILGGGTKFSTGRQLRFYLLHLYIKGFQEGRLGYASALAWVLILLSSIVVFVVYRLFEKRVYYEESVQR